MLESIRCLGKIRKKEGVGYVGIWDRATRDSLVDKVASKYGPKGSKQTQGERAFAAVGKTSAKALQQKHVWCVPGKVVSWVCLEQTEWGQE